MKNRKQTNYVAVGIAIGAAIGAAIGIGMGNPGISISVGIALGAFIGYAKQKDVETQQNSEL